MLHAVAPQVPLSEDMALGRPPMFGQCRTVELLQRQPKELSPASKDVLKPLGLDGKFDQRSFPCLALEIQPLNLRAIYAEAATLEHRSQNTLPTTVT